ncbi:hypothetical protein SAMN04488490_4344 [Marinobacter sp. LV10R510-11A]|uniref:hypothetical protein n=1 Tax=Marinobacter sp. LV10R510-11A TaxID=1415568 RepID=UPI000BC00D6A|nr:hypothetical protein [Marinobacter sp. LV10R510-11A]SOB78465.1 hypothetical protein SAMN04488490_4344 [Marinobacter sp. LV10R510-11A]
MHKFRGMIVAISIALLGGCASPRPPMTPEQQAMAQEMQKAFIARMNAGVRQQQAAQPAPVSEPVSLISEQELAEQIAAVKSDGDAVEIRRVRDGLMIGGAPYLDPEGEITGFSANALAGDIVYALKSGRNELTFKYLSSAGNSEPVTLGTATKDTTGVSFTSVTGKKLAGQNVVGTSTGVLVTRDASVFHYTPGQRVSTLMVPESYHVAALQKGDFGSTGYLLIEKNEETKEGLAGLTSIVGSLGETVGLSEADGYMLLNAETGELVKLDISTDDKDVSIGRGCERQNDFVNKCSSFDSYESLYRPDGTRNRGHYFWRVDWMQTPEGPFAVVQEAGTRKINVINLNEDKRVTVLERTLGIASHDVTQAPDGTIRVEAQMGFSKETVSDSLKAYDAGLRALSAAK